MTDKLSYHEKFRHHENGRYHTLRSKRVVTVITLSSLAERIHSDNDASEVDILGYFGTFWDILGHFGTIGKTF